MHRFPMLDVDSTQVLVGWARAQALPIGDQQHSCEASTCQGAGNQPRTPKGLTRSADERYTTMAPMGRAVLPHPRRIPEFASVFCLWYTVLQSYPKKKSAAALVEPGGLEPGSTSTRFMNILAVLPLFVTPLTLAVGHG